MTSRFCFLDSHRLNLGFRVCGNSKLSEILSQRTVAYLAAPSTQIKSLGGGLDVERFRKEMDVLLSYCFSLNASDPGHCLLKTTKDGVKTIKSRARRSSEAPVPLVEAKKCNHWITVATRHLVWVDWELLIKWEQAEIMESTKHTVCTKSTTWNLESVTSLTSTESRAGICSRPSRCSKPCIYATELGFEMLQDWGIRNNPKLFTQISL